MEPDNPLLGAPNCLITPHFAAFPVETRERLLKRTVENLAAWQAGRADPCSQLIRPMKKGGEITGTRDLTAFSAGAGELFLSPALSEESQGCGKFPDPEHCSREEPNPPISLRICQRKPGSEQRILLPEFFAFPVGFRSSGSLPHPEADSGR